MAAIRSKETMGRSQFPTRQDQALCSPPHPRRFPIAIRNDESASGFALDRPPIREQEPFTYLTILPRHPPLFRRMYSWFRWARRTGCLTSSTSLPS